FASLWLCRLFLWWLHKSFDLGLGPASFFGSFDSLTFTACVVFDLFFKVVFLSNDSGQMFYGLHAFFIDFSCFVKHCLFKMICRLFHASSLRQPISFLQYKRSGVVAVLAPI